MPKSREAAIKALRIDDTLAEAHTSLTSVQAFFDYDLSNAEREFKRAIELNPGSASAHQWYGWYLFVLKRADEAVKEIKRAQELDPLSLIINGELGMPYARSGNRTEAQKIIEKLKEQSKQRYIPLYAVAWIYEALGEKQQALDWLEKSYENREDTMLWLNSDPSWDDLRSEPRFQDLVQRVRQ